jgi:predicted XRE-type DNA-binding protein
VWYEQGLRPDLRHCKRQLMTEGSDNPFSDLGFKEPELELAKSRLVAEAVIAERKLSRADTARIVGLSQPRLTRLMNNVSCVSQMLMRQYLVSDQCSPAIWWHRFPTPRRSSQEAISRAGPSGPIRAMWKSDPRPLRLWPRFIAE